MKMVILSMFMALLAFITVFAQDEPGMEESIIFYASEEEIDPFVAYAYEIIHQTVFATQQEVPETVTEVPGEWEDVGLVNDLILTRDREFKAFLVDVGGFLGIAARTVAIDAESVKMVWVEDELPADTSGEVENPILHRDELVEFFLVIQTTREELENAPEFERRGW